MLAVVGTDCQSGGQYAVHARGVSDSQAKASATGETRLCLDLYRRESAVLHGSGEEARIGLLSPSSASFLLDVRALQDWG